MEELRAVLKTHQFLYPFMQVNDYVKLIYQNEMGGGHMIKDEESCLSFLEEEAESIHPSKRSFEDIGNSIGREYLSDMKERNIPLSWLSSMFVFTSCNHRGNKEALKEKLELFYQMVKDDEIHLDLRETENFLYEYREKDFPPIHHSTVFRENYRPAYRIVYKKYGDFLNVFERAAKLKKEKDRVIIVIDGRCGCGKTTSALLLQKVFNCPVIHMDDFFLPPSMRTEERLASPGGNIHYEYFKERVAVPLRENKEISFKPFDCSCGDFKEEIKIPFSDFLIIEGSYALHPYFENMGDIRVFCDIDEKEQRERIIKRNGEAFAENFFLKWIPMEEKYFDTFLVREKADFIIK